MTVSGIVRRKELSMKKELCGKLRQFKFLVQHSQVANQILLLRKSRILIWILERTANKCEKYKLYRFLLRWKYNISNHIQGHPTDHEKPREITHRGKVLKLASFFGIEKFITVCQEYRSRFFLKTSDR